MEGYEARPRIQIVLHQAEIVFAVSGVEAAVAKVVPVKELHSCHPAADHLLEKRDQLLSVIDRPFTGFIRAQRLGKFLQLQKTVTVGKGFVESGERHVKVGGDHIDGIRRQLRCQLKRFSAIGCEHMREAAGDHDIV